MNYSHYYYSQFFSPFFPPLFVSRLSLLFNLLLENPPSPPKPPIFGFGLGLGKPKDGVFYNSPISPPSSSPSSSDSS